MLLFLLLQSCVFFPLSWYSLLPQGFLLSGSSGFSSSGFSQLLYKQTIVSPLLPLRWALIVTSCPSTHYMVSAFYPSFPFGCSWVVLFFFHSCNVCSSPAISNESFNEALSYAMTDYAMQRQSVSWLWRFCAEGQLIAWHAPKRTIALTFWPAQL